MLKNCNLEYTGIQISIYISAHLPVPVLAFLLLSLWPVCKNTRSKTWGNQHATEREREKEREREREREREA